MNYTVPAVAQTNPDGYGPAYLVNGLTSAEYWYQVGLSYNWDINAGFMLNYEVFNPAGNSIFPTNGGGGAVSFSGAINPGDNIVLSLTFSNGNVIMKGTDQNTGASAQETYGAYGQTTFIGTPSGVADSNGYWTGLMTEEYHNSPYYGDEQTVVYTDNGAPVSAAWMWIEEISVASNGQTGQIFSAQTNSAYSFANPMQLQSFSSNGATASINATEFITGGISSPTAQSSVPLIFSYSISGGAGTSSAPVLTYTAGGATHSAALTQTAQTFTVDSGSSWSVTSPVSASSSPERWQSTQATSGTASSSQTIGLVFYHQFLVTFAFTISGGGSGYSPPLVTYQQFGSQVTTPVGAQVWSDAAAYSYAASLPGSTSSEQWIATPATGTVSAPSSINAQYAHQYYVTLTANPTAGGNVSVASGWFNAGANLQTTASAASGWSFEDWNGSGQGSYTGATASISEVVNSPLSESAVFYPGLTVSSSNNVTVSYSYGSSSGSVPAGSSNTLFAPVGTTIQLNAKPSSFIYSFGGWTGSSASGGPNASVILNSPLTLAASSKYNAVFLGIVVAVVIVVVAALVLLISRKRRQSTGATPSSVTKELAGLKSLVDSGAISQGEFEMQKTIILHPGAAGTCDAVIKLERLKEMLDKNLVTQQDYDEKKKNILEECTK